MSLEGITEVLAIQGSFAGKMEAGDERIDIRLERDGSGFECARFGRVHLAAHERHEATCHDLPMTGRPVYLHLMRARVRI